MVFCGSVSVGHLRSALSGAILSSMRVRLKNPMNPAEGKSLPDHPAFHSDVPLTFQQSGKPGLISQREASRHSDALYGSQAIDWVMDCVELYAEAVANADFHFEEGADRLWLPDEADKPDGAKLADPFLAKLFEEPNPFMGYEEMMSLLVMDLLLVGNAYWMKWQTFDNGKPLALYRLAPPFVRIQPGPYGPLGYEYDVPGQKKPLKLGVDEVVHFRRPNPHHAHYGAGKILGGGRSLDLELALTEHQASYFEQGTQPSMILESERRVSKDVWEKLRKNMRTRYSGPSNAGKLLILEAGLKATSLTPNAADAQFVALTKLSRDRIFAMFRASPMLFGIIDEPAGGVKVSDVRREFDNSVLRPFMNSIQKQITRKLTQPAWDVKFKIDHEYIVPREDQIKLAGDFASIPGVMVKQVLAFLGLPPTGDDSIDDLVLNLPGDNGLPGDTRNGFPDMPLPGEPGRPPKRDNTAAFGTVGGGSRPDLVSGARARRPSEKKAITIEDALERLSRLNGKSVASGDGTLEP
jgi:HK97 family phage portal protein